jgi:hypothetical protein
VQAAQAAEQILQILEHLGSEEVRVCFLTKARAQAPDPAAPALPLAAQQVKAVGLLEFGSAWSYRQASFIQ